MHCSFIIARSAALLALLLPMRSMAQGQQGSGSPYSGYGLGEFVGSTPIAQAMMGGLVAAAVDPVSTVFANPASYPALHRTTFETGLGVRNSQLASATTERIGRRTEIMGLTLGLPFGKGRWGVALGVRPVSRVNYSLTETESIPGSTGVSTFTYTGDGGLNQAILGMGLVVSQQRDSLANGHRLSIGANVGYLFGRIETGRSAVFPSGQGFYASRITSTTLLRDPTADLGLQFQGDLRKRRTKDDEGLFFLAGVAAELPVSIRAERNEVANTFGFSSSGLEVPLDTSYAVSNLTGRVDLPLGLRVGFTAFNEQWTMGAEYGQRDWTTLGVSDARFQPVGQLANSTALRLGASYRPSNEVIGSIWKRTVYRAGLQLTNDYLKVGGTQLQDRSATVGLSIPMMATTTRSRLNIGGAFGERGTVENGLIRERYFTLLLGITITPDVREGWFRKRRID